MMRQYLLLATYWAAAVHAFTTPLAQSSCTLCVSECAALQATTHNDDDESQRTTSEISSRRTVLSSLPMLGLSLVGATLASPNVAWADGAEEEEEESATTKVLVLGGTGLVGSRVVATLQEKGISVISTSRDGRDGTVALDFTKSKGEDLKAKIASLADGCTAVISCVGAIGTPDDEIVNSGSGIAAIAAKQAGVPKFVCLTVAPEVKVFAKDIDFLKGYMSGKTFSRDAVLSTFGSSGATLIEPTFIYGGDAFSLNPPRVAGFYGQFIESILASGPIRAVEGITPDGIIKIALEPPISADAVARAAVWAALSSTEQGGSILDTHDKIAAAAAAL